MKIVFLNTWNAEVHDAMKAFIKEHSGTTDIFCFQEAGDAMKELAHALLAGYIEAERYKYVTDHDYFPQVTYVRKSVPLLSSGAIMEKEGNVGLGLYIEVRHGDQNLSICNFHGMSQPGSKLDNPERIFQSRTLIDFFKNAQAHTIIGGDFNLLPDTESVRMFAGSGYRDLIKDHHITNTRNRFTWEKHPDSMQYYSDYAFVGSGISVKSFSVPNIEVSDHLPLILEIE